MTSTSDTSQQPGVGSIGLTQPTDVYNARWGQDSETLLYAIRGKAETTINEALQTMGIPGLSASNIELARTAIVAGAEATLQVMRMYGAFAETPGRDTMHPVVQSWHDQARPALEAWETEQALEFLLRGLGDATTEPGSADQ